MYILATDVVQCTTVPTMTMPMAVTTPVIHMNVDWSNVNIGPVVVTVTMTSASATAALPVEVKGVDNMIVMMSMWIAIVPKWSKTNSFEIVRSRNKPTHSLRQLW